MLQFLRAKRVVVCVCLLGSLGLVSGCGDSDPVAAVGTEGAMEKGKAQQAAREAAYGKGGVPKTEKAVRKP
jgi:hypothetical protein